MQYQLIDQTSPKDFNTAVNNFLKDRWDLYGDTIIQNEAGTMHYYQAMVKGE